jgi:PAS domain S-box-containing protein
MRQIKKTGIAKENSSGEQKPVIATLFDTADTGVPGLGDAIDLSLMLKEPHEKIRESEERYSAIFERAAFPMALTRMADGVTVSVNEAFARLFGFSREETIGKTTVELGITDAASRDLMMVRMGEQASIRDFETKRRTKYGKELFVVLNMDRVDIGGESYILTMIQDITERKRAEEALRISEEKFSKAFKNSPTAITITRLVDGKIIEGNGYSISLFGYRPEEVIGKTTNDLALWAFPEDRKKLVRELSSKGFIKNQEFVLRKKDGSLFTVDLSASFITIENEQCFISSFIDITKRKQAEEALRESEDKYRRQATELAASNRDLDSFSYSVAHELRNPLNNIGALFKVLQKDCREALGENGVFCIDHIEKNVFRMANVISGLLQLSHIARQNIQARKVDLTRIAWEAAELLRESDKKRQVEIIIQKDLTAQADENLMRVALNNLIGNAWKYSSKNALPRIEVGAKSDRGGRVFFVRDNGIGFSMTDTERIFLPFQRAHSIEEFKGSGIGLSTVKRIIEKHNGRIWAQSEAGKGATFYFTIEPVKESPCKQNSMGADEKAV